MKTFYLFLILTFFVCNFANAQDSFPEQQAVDSLKVTSNESVFTDKQLLFINEMLLQRSEVYMDRTMDIFGKIIDTVALFFTLFSIGIAILTLIGFNEMRQIKQFRKNVEDSLKQIRQEGIDEFIKLKNDIIQRSNELNIDLDNTNSKLKEAIKEVSRLNHIELWIKEGNWKYAYDEIQNLKKELRDEKNLLLLKKQEAIVRSFDSKSSFYSLDIARKLMNEYLIVNPTDSRALDLLGYFEYEFWNLKEDNFHLDNGINFFEKIVNLDKSETEPIEIKRAYANIAEGYKRKQNYKIALDYLNKAENIEDFTNKSLEEFINRTKQHCLKMDSTGNEA